MKRLAEDGNDSVRAAVARNMNLQADAPALPSVASGPAPSVPNGDEVRRFATRFPSPTAAVGALAEACGIAVPARKSGSSHGQHLREHPPHLS